MGRNHPGVKVNMFERPSKVVEKNVGKQTGECYLGSCGVLLYLYLITYFPLIPLKDMQLLGILKWRRRLQESGGFRFKADSHAPIP